MILTATHDAAYVAVDWGTSSFRLWVLARDGEALAERQGGFGMATLKPADFGRVLEEALAELGVPAETPVVICGMAGAAQGWIEAPYVDCPVRLTDLPSWAIRIPGVGRDIRIMPGLAQRNPEAPDVMRGEETLLLGAWLDQACAGTICLPGTHSKWARLEAGSVIRFSSAMTGELYGLLANSSTLSAYLGTSQPSTDSDGAFDSAVRESMASPAHILRALFSIRAAPLLQGTGPDAHLAARLSGLLVGLEIAGMRKRVGDSMTLISTGILAQNYAQAFRAAGMACAVINSDAMARAGLHHAAQMIWPHLTRN